MDYAIKNRKNVYIRLNQNDNPVTCTEYEKTLFEHSKAKNILDSLPKTLRRLNFKVELVLDIVNIEPKQKVIESHDFRVSSNIKRWIEKLGICDDILKAIWKRKDE